MSSKYAVFGKASPAASEDILGESTSAIHGEYKDLIRRLFQGRTAVALLGSGLSASTPSICQEIASELSDIGRRVVLVSVDSLLQTTSQTISENPAAPPTEDRQYWLWPSSVRTQMECVKPRLSGVAAKNWLECLRQDFDVVVLNCPPLASMPGCAALAAMADATVLVVDAQRTPKHQVLMDQRLLLLSNVKLAGCILVKGN